MVNYSVLDHGYLGLVESWGSDERIVEAARMSTGKGFLGWGPSTVCQCGREVTEANALDHRECGSPTKFTTSPGDEKLLRYLWENKHATPFEMAGMTIEVQAPIFVFREWHRHRTQCLVGETMIACVSPNGTTYQRSIKNIFDLKYGGVEDTQPRTRNGTSRGGTPVRREARRVVPWRKRVLPNCQARALRVLNETTGEFETAPMADVWESGTKPVFCVKTETGRTVEASAEHPFFTRDGWKKLKELRVGDSLARIGVVATRERPLPPALRAGIGVWTSMMRARLIRQPTDFCYLCETEFKFSILELDHVVPVSADLLRALDATNLRPICPRCHKNKSAAEQPSREGMTRRGVRWERVVEVREVGDAPTYDIEVDGPHHNFVANGLVVHNSYNEMSSRYMPLPDVNYIPSVERLMLNSKTNKQAGTVKGSEEMTEPKAGAVRHALSLLYGDQQRAYEEFLKWGVPKELARVHLPVGRYSRMRASANLRNWLAFLTLRMDEKAQWEIRQYANVVGEIISAQFPRTWALFSEKR
jgi:thymidylate synthase (FAD)